jgi:hypothetical protein
MGREEQIEEREVLDSIFPDEIQGKVKSVEKVARFIAAFNPASSPLEIY